MKPARLTKKVETRRAKWDVQDPVSLVPVEVQGQTIPHVRIVRNDNTGEFTRYAVGTDYELIPHTAIISRVDDAIRRLELGDPNVTHRCDTFGLYKGTWKFPKLTQEPKVGDPISFAFTARNGYDGTVNLYFMGGLFRLACDNGQVSFDAIRSMRKRHTQSINLEDIQYAILMMRDQFDRDIQLTSKLPHIVISPTQGENIIRNMQSTFGKRVAEKLIERWHTPNNRLGRSQENAFDLMNTFTEYFTHEYRFNRRTELSVETARLFHRIIQDPKVLDSLTATPSNN